MKLICWETLMHNDKEFSSILDSPSSPPSVVVSAAVCKILLPHEQH